MLTSKWFSGTLATTLLLLLTTTLIIYSPLTFSTFFILTYLTTYAITAQLNLNRLKENDFTVERYISTSICQVEETVKMRVIVRNRSGRRYLVKAEDMANDLELVSGSIGGEKQLDDGESMEISYTIKPRSRGAYVIGPLRLRIYDDYRACVRELSLGPTATLFATPAQRLDVKIPEAVAMSRDFRVAGSGYNPFTGPEETFRGIRPYITGEVIRRVDWKKTARDPEHELHVREFERQSQMDIVFMLDCSPSMLIGGEKTILDEVLEEIISVSQTLIARGDRVGLITLGTVEDAEIQPTGGGAAYKQLIQAVAKTKPAKSYDIMREASRVRPGITLFIVGRFAYTRPEELKTVSKYLTRRGVRAFFICVRKKQKPHPYATLYLEKLEEERIAWLKKMNPTLIVIEPSKVKETIAFLYQILKRGDVIRVY
ncbi:MAG: DUF58 domain-containing protein [Aigarchaeota archaeon]|nr:DUF58 domain-containing protein [Candidatus Pelearchaeum maunauluense]